MVCRGVRERSATMGDASERITCATVVVAWLVWRRGSLRAQDEVGFGSQGAGKQRIGASKQSNTHSNSTQAPSNEIRPLTPFSTLTHAAPYHPCHRKLASEVTDLPSLPTMLSHKTYFHIPNHF